MKLKLNNLIEPINQQELHPSLVRFANLDLPIKTGFRLKGIIKQAVEHFNTYQESRLDLYKKHGEHDAEKDEYTIPADKAPAFQADFSLLVDVGIEITGERLKISDFYSHSSIKANDLLALDWLIDDGQPVETVVEATASGEAVEGMDVLDLLSEGNPVETAN